MKRPFEHMLSIFRIDMLIFQVGGREDATVGGGWKLKQKSIELWSLRNFELAKSLLGGSSQLGYVVNNHG